MALDPDEQEARFRLARLLRDGGQHAEAIRLFEAVPPGDSRWRDAQAQLFDLRAEAAFKANSLQDLQDAVRRQPGSAQARLLLGMRLQRDGKNADALPHLRRAAALDPRSGRAATLIGIALLDLKRADEALPWFLKAVALEPGNPTCAYNLGNAHLRKNRLEAAASAYRKALAMNPDYPEANCNLGHVLRALGLLSESLAAFRRGHSASLAVAGWRYPSARWLADAERLARVEKRLPGLLDGSLAPEAKNERLLAAEACRLKKLHLGRARLLEKAMKDDPGRHREGAAAAAALAGTGQGDDAKAMDEAAQARWRGKALAWLGAEADAQARRARSRSPQAAAQARAALRRIQASPDFAAVRDAGRLEALPAAEAQRWAALWEAVRQALPDEA